MIRLLLLFLLLATPAYADVLTKVGTFQKCPSSGGALCSSANTNTVTGIGFTPKAVILYSYSRNVLGSFEGDPKIIMGWSDGTTEYSQALYNTDNVSTTDAVRGYHSTKITGDLSVLNLYLALGDVTFASGQFTVTWTTNDVEDIYFAYIALGGSDLEIKVSNQVMPTSGSAIFPHGLTGGAPDIVFLLSASYTASASTQGHANFSLGTVMSSSSRWTTTFAATDAATTTGNMDAVKRQTAAKCLQGIAVGAAGVDGQLDFEADFSAKDATNLTLSFSDYPPSAYAFSMLSIRGGNWALGATNKRSGTGDQNIATGLSGTTKLLMLASFGATTTSSSVNDMEFAFGASDGTNQAEVWNVIEGTTLATLGGRSMLATNILAYGSAAAGAVTMENAAVIKTSSPFTGGNATITWGTGDANADEILWATVGEAVTGNPYSYYRMMRQP